MKMQAVISFISMVFLFSISCSNQSGNKQENSTVEMNKESEYIVADHEVLGTLVQYVEGIEDDFSSIPDERKEQLEELALYVKTKNTSEEPSNLIFICTHNSRRSHMSQLWAQTAAHYYGIENVYSFSGGTEATAFNPRSVKALRKAGFSIEQTDSTSNPVYLVTYADGVEPVKGFSKKYDDEFNPQEDFVAVMTCSHADEACPLVYGSTLRVAIPYEDSKVADNTPEEEAKYDERCRQIATEMFYIFSKAKSI